MEWKRLPVCSLPRWCCDNGISVVFAATKISSSCRSGPAFRPCKSRQWQPLPHRLTVVCCGEKEIFPGLTEIFILARPPARFKSKAFISTLKIQSFESIYHDQTPAVARSTFYGEVHFSTSLNSDSQKPVDWWCLFFVRPCQHQTVSINKTRRVLVYRTIQRSRFFPHTKLFSRVFRHFQFHISRSLKKQKPSCK